MAVFDVDLFLGNRSSAFGSVGQAANGSLTFTTAHGMIPAGAVHTRIFEDFSVDDSSLGDIIDIIMESISASVSLSSPGSIFLQFVSETIATDDLTKGIVTLIIQEGIGLDDILSNYRVYHDLIQEFCTANGLLFSTGTFIGAISVAFSIGDLVSDPEIVGEGFQLADDVLANIAALGSIVEAMTISSAVSDQLSLFCLVQEDLSVQDSISSTGIFQALIEEDISFGLVVTVDGVVYEGWLMNPETFAVWNYSNYNFNSITRFGEKYLLANENGLYEMEDKFDDGEAIIAKIKTASMDFGTSGLKQISELILGVVNSGKLVLKVTVDGQQTVYYELKPGTRNLENQRVKIGKGLHGRYWQFELITSDNSDFDLDSFEVLPFVFGRRFR